MSCGIGRRRGSDPALLWLWCRPAASAPNRPLPWEPPYATGVALKRQRKGGGVDVLQLDFEVDGNVIILIAEVESKIYTYTYIHTHTYTHMSNFIYVSEFSRSYNVLYVWFIICQLYLKHV